MRASFLSEDVFSKGKLLCPTAIWLSKWRFAVLAIPYNFTVRLRVVPHFPSGIAERAKRGNWKKKLKDGTVFDRLRGWREKDILHAIVMKAKQQIEQRQRDESARS